MPQPLPELTDRLLQAARAAGADAADAMAVDATSLSVEVRGGALEQAERAESIDIGLRVFLGRRSALVSASDTSDRTIAEMASRAVAMAREAPEDPHAGLADPEQLSQAHDAAGLDLCDPAPEPSPEHLQDLAARAEAAALGNDGISQIDSAGAGYGAQRVHLAASNGFSGGYARSETGMSCVAITGTGAGMERDHDSDSRIFAADLRTPEDIGNSAARRTLARHNPRKPPTGRYPVLFDERVAASLIGHLLSAVSGVAIARGASWLRDAKGTRILPDGVDLSEDPHRPRTRGSRRFDAEGLPTVPRAIVQDGVLQGWTLDLATARKLGLPSTANAVRGVSGAPQPGVSNVALTQGSDSRDDLISQMGTGLLVTSMIGSTINPNTGDYSRGAAGMWVENGALAYPVNECTIAGNLTDMLRALVPANDARRHLSRVVPSLLVPGMTLAGA